MFNGIPFFSFNQLLSTGEAFSLSGGVTSSYVDGVGDTVIVHTFNSSDTLTVTGTGDIDYLLIGGGGGGSNGGNYGGGGGAGEQIYRTSVSISDGSYTVTIGAGGAAQVDGTQTDLVGVGTASFGYRAYGLGYNSNVLSGKSIQDGSVYIGGVGSNSSPFSGGGGAGGSQNGFDNTASPAGEGGDGLSNSITGSAVTRGGGGGGANNNKSGLTLGGNGGGGDGGWNAGGQQYGRPGTANTGSGGGGAVNNTGGAGGSGVIIVSYVLV